MESLNRTTEIRQGQRYRGQQLSEMASLRLIGQFLSKAGC